MSDMRFLGCIISPFSARWFKLSPTSTDSLSHGGPLMSCRRSVSVLFILATMSTVLSAQGASGPRYLALGDSVTFGFINNGGFEYVNAANFIGFPTYAGSRVKMDALNASCPGETTASF